MRFVAFTLTVVVLTSNLALAQTTAPATTAPVPAEVDEKAWSFSLSAYTYIVPDDHEYVQPTITIDRDWLHLEARYDYEALDTASTWVGYNLAGGEKVAWEITPMLGGVSGETSGIAPGYKGSLTWWKIELYSEGEYVFDLDDSSDSYFYNWSELTLSPAEWLRFGIVAQRTRLYDSDRDIQRGLLVGLSWQSLDLAAYVLNPDEGKPTWIFSIAVSF